MYFNEKSILHYYVQFFQIQSHMVKPQDTICVKYYTIQFGCMCVAFDPVCWLYMYKFYKKSIDNMVSLTETGLI